MLAPTLMGTRPPPAGTGSVVGARKGTGSTKPSESQSPLLICCLAAAVIANLVVATRLLAAIVRRLDSAAVTAGPRMMLFNPYVTTPAIPMAMKTIMMAFPRSAKRVFPEVSIMRFSQFIFKDPILERRPC
jgi:hypothetical protein